MPDRINFHSLAVEPRKRFTRAFHDPKLAQPFVLTLEEPDALTDYRAAELSAELVRRYLTGDEALGMPPQPFMVGGEARQPTERMCDHAGLIVAMQPEDVPQPYQGEEILQMAFKLPKLWREVRAWVLELDRGAEETLPNALAGREESSSGPPLNVEVYTPPLSPGSPIPCAVSTSPLWEKVKRV